MKITRRQIKRIIKEAQQENSGSRFRITERGSGNPGLESAERALMSAVVGFEEKYMLAMGMDPSNVTDVQRARRAIDDIIASVLG